MTLFDIVPYTEIEEKSMKAEFKTTGEIASNIRTALKEIERVACADLQQASSTSEPALRSGWPSNYFICNTKERIQNLVSEIEKHKAFFFDCETTGLDPWKDRVQCISFEVAGNGYLVPFEHTFLTCVSKELARELLKDVFAREDIRRSGHNVLFDAAMVEQDVRIFVQSVYADTMVQSQVIRPGNDTPHGLKELCNEYGIERSKGDYKEQFGKTAWSHVEWKVGSLYAIKDSILTAKLHTKQNEVLDAEIDWNECFEPALGIKMGTRNLKNIFWDIEMPMNNIVLGMERRGVRVDQKYFDETLKPKVYSEWYKATDDISPFIEPYLSYAEKTSVVDVLESPTALMKICFDKLNIPLIKYVTLQRQPAGHPEAGLWTKRSLDKQAIQSLKKEYPVIALLSEYRMWSQLKKLCVDAYPELMSNGRLHPRFNTCRAATGRMSSYSPNFTQVPSRVGALVRNLIIPDEGNILMSVDFSGQEVRILAHYSRDEKLVDFYRNPNGLDIYSQTAYDAFALEDFTSQRLTRESFKQLKKEDRKETAPYRNAKALVLGLGYGLGAASFARKSGMTKQEGQKKFDGYHKAYPGVHKFHEKVWEFTRKHGYMTSIIGRRRYLPHIHSPIDSFRADAERASINQPIQSSAGEMLKISAIRVSALIEKYKWPIWISLLIHDEILFEANEKFILQNPQVMDEIRQTMCNAVPLIVPMETSISYMERWGSNIELSDLDDIEEEMKED